MDIRGRLTKLIKLLLLMFFIAQTCCYQYSKPNNAVVYVLKLEQGKYYVGQTQKPINMRVSEHVSGYGSAWTRKYKVVDLKYVCDAADIYAENNLTLKYMSQFGIDNVRGGLYSSIYLSSVQRNEIERHIRHDTGACLNCGKKGHFLSSCPYPKQYNGIGDGPINASDKKNRRAPIKLSASTPFTRTVTTNLYRNNDKGKKIVKTNTGYTTQRSSSSSSQDEKKHQTCRGTNRDGTRCRAYLYLNNGGFCPRHLSQQ